MFNMRTLMHVFRQRCFTRTLETTDIDVCCIQAIHIQVLSSAIRLTFPICHSVKLHLRLSGDSEASASGVSMALSERPEVALLDWMPADGRLCTERLRGSCKFASSSPHGRNLFVVSVFGPIDCSPNAIKSIFYDMLHKLLRTAKRSEIVINSFGCLSRIP